ncbi:hypothetical protein BDF20DRAFT_905072 [Mycotypha africana]|uniref:uncharacterized protein n=1 Tax=Mycotypha africana TaxID=64632 RepID=UPI002301BF6D|nr:uncharacterized protein BDF20DRAFT_905072 [Mycotypha africana]KAI8988540.1 hypothetical protein BDF20DRAFT_905072 [Mycotypha africana]
MEKLLNTEWPDHDIKANVFGSSVNDLGGMQHIVCVPRAKVPIVRLFDPELQLSCDINVNNTLALQNTKMIKTYVALDPRVRPLIMTIKHWTKKRLLNDAANGGTLSSYTWTCLVINFLQQRQPPILPVLHMIENECKSEDYFYDNIEKLKGFGSSNHESLGGLLFAFFRRYAVEFNYDNQVVSVRQGRYMTKKEKGWDTGRNKVSLCVEEPFNISRNLGNSADIASVHGIRCEFQRCLDQLLAGENLNTICTPYHPPTFLRNSSKNDTHPSNANINNDLLSLTLPTGSHNSAFLLPTNVCINPMSPYTTSHPYDRRRSMVDGVYNYRPSSPSSEYNNYYPYTHRLLPSFKPHRRVPPIFNPGFSSPQAIDTILRIRNTRHGSHPLSPVPPSLITMVNAGPAHLPDQSVDKIFARYQKKHQKPSHQTYTNSNEVSQPMKRNNMTNDRRKGDIAGKGGPTPTHCHHDFKNSRRRSNDEINWPAISGSNSNLTKSMTFPESPDNDTQDHLFEATTNTNFDANTDAVAFLPQLPQYQRTRRWSTVKKMPTRQPPNSSTVNMNDNNKNDKLVQEPKKLTLAEIVKSNTPSTPVKPRVQLPSSLKPSPSTSTSSSKSTNSSSRNHSKKSRNNNNNSSNGNRHRKKKS